LAAQGVKVCLSGRNQEKLEALSLEIEDSCIAPCDLTDQTSRAELVNEAEKSLGSTVDILVNNAGVTADTLIMRMSLEQWEKVIDVNQESSISRDRASSFS
jgi:3-oxoacyl-[acyl-carrier protein] reductase